MAAFSRTYAGRSRRAFFSGVIQILGLFIFGVCIYYHRISEHEGLMLAGMICGALLFILGLPVCPKGHDDKWLAGVGAGTALGAFLFLAVGPGIKQSVPVAIGMVGMALLAFWSARHIRRKTRRVHTAS